MASIFLSHSSQDNEVAGDLSRRLKEHGYDSLFLDFDPDSGIKGGRDWERELYRNLKLAGAVIVLCSPHSMASRWCFVEIAQAKALGKAIFPIKIDACQVENILKDRQVIDLTAVGADEAYRRLVDGLCAAGFDPKDSFHWDTKRAPFPGLNYFDAEDASVYFGREDEVRLVIETLTRLQRQGEPRLLVVVGSSGSGKSSLVRAGVLPRLAKDRSQWALVNPFRPGAEPIRSVARSLFSAFPEGPDRPDWKAIRDRLRDESREANPGEGSAALMSSALTEYADDLTMHLRSPEASVLLVVDQVEELLQNVASDEASAFFNVLRRATARAGGRVFGLLTLRSDFLGSFQNHPALRGLAFADLPLGLLPVENFPQVIEGPADRAEIALEPGLVRSMIADARTDDALPLLAFTLREMYERCRNQQRLTLKVYRDDLGGIKGAVARVVERIKTEGTWTSEVGSALRRAFLKLVRVNDEGQFTRQPCRWADLPDLAAPVLEAFVKARLLSSNGDVVEVTHESLFRVWPELAGWLDESRELMLWRKNLQDEVKDWSAHDHSPLYLLGGARVAEGRRWLASNADDFPGTESEFIVASIAAENGRIARERAQQKKLRWLARSLAVVAVAASFVGVYALVQRNNANAKAKAALEAEAKTNTTLIAVKQENRKAFQALSDFHLERGRALVEGEDNRGFHWIASALAFAPVDDKARQYTIRAELSIADKRSTKLKLMISTLSADERPSAEKLLGDEMPAPDNAAATTKPIVDVEKTVADRPASATIEIETRLAEVRRQQLTTDVGERLKVARDLVAKGDRRGALSSLRLAQNIVRSDDGIDEPTRQAHDRRIQAQVLSIEWTLYAAALSPDGKTVLTGSEDGTAQLWSAADGSAIGSPMRHENIVNAVAFSPDGKTVLTNCNGGSARLWNATDGSAIGEPMRHGGSSAVAFSPDSKTVLTGGGDNTARLWSAADGSAIGEPMRHRAGVRAVAFSSDGKTVLTGTEIPDTAAQLWNAADGKPIGLPMKIGFEVVAVAFSPDGKTVLTAGSQTKTATLWSAADGKPIGKPMEHPYAVNCAAFSPDGKIVLTGSDDGSARLWNATDGSTIGAIMQLDSVDSVAFSPDSQTILTGSSRTARLWNAADGTAIGTPMMHQNVVETVAFSPDGKTILTAGPVDGARLWNIPEGELFDLPMIHRGAVIAAAFSHDGKTLLTGGFDGTARLWNTSDGMPVGQPMRHSDAIFDVAFSPDGRTVLTRSYDGTARLWNSTIGELIDTLKTLKGKVDSVAFSPDGKTVLTGSEDGTARLWNATNGTPIGRPMLHRDKVYAVAFSPDGKTVLTGSEDGTARLWSAVDGSAVGKPMVLGVNVDRVAFNRDGKIVLTGSAWGVRLWKAADQLPVGIPMMMNQGLFVSMALSPDGKNVLLGTNDRRAQLWDAEEGKPIGTPMIHQDQIRTVAFSPDGMTILTAAGDRAQIWNAANCKPIGSAMVVEREIMALTFSPDGKTIFTGGVTGTARLWEAPRAIAGEPRRISLWVDVVTGTELLEETNSIRVLDAKTWGERRRELNALGGPPLP